MNKLLRTTYAMVLMVGIAAVFVLGQTTASAQQPAAGDSGTEIIESSSDSMASEYVTINVKNPNKSEVLNA